MSRERRQVASFAWAAINSESTFSNSGGGPSKRALNTWSRLWVIIGSSCIAAPVSLPHCMLWEIKWMMTNSIDPPLRCEIDLPYPSHIFSSHTKWKFISSCLKLQCSIVIAARVAEYSRTVRLTSLIPIINCITKGSDYCKICFIIFRDKLNVFFIKLKILFHLDVGKESIFYKSSSYPHCTIKNSP